MGEDTAEFENGKVATRAGSFEAGVDGAQPGIAIPAKPADDVAYRQEYYKGHAEDVGEILSVGEQAMPNRLEVCRRCRGTLKLATVPVPTPPELLTIVDTAFVALEGAAGDQRYGPAAAR